MADFYALPPAEQAQRLAKAAKAALPQWDIDPRAEVTLIKHRENAVFSLAEGGERFAMRVHRANYHSDAELASELQWTAALNAAGIRAPQVRSLPDGRLFTTLAVLEVPEPRQIDLLEWFEGEPLATIEDGFEASDDIADTFGAIGGLMAQVHNQSAEWTLPSNFERHAWDEGGLLGEAPFWGRFWDLSLLSSVQRQRLLEVREHARADLLRFGKSRENYGLIHADLLPENILRNGTELCLIDFDDSGFGWHLFDAATTLFFLQGEDYYADAKRALIAGYRKRRALAAETIEWLDFFLLMRGLTYLGWAHSRAETETARSLGPMLVEMVDEMAIHYLRRRS